MPSRTTVFTLLVLLLLAAPDAGMAQAVLFGRVTDGERPVSFANVGVRGTTLGAAADEDGAYRISNIPTGTYTIVASAVGFGTREMKVTVSAGEERRVDFSLQEAVVHSDGIVVTATMKETFISESPVKVEVISGRALEKRASANLMEVIENINGLTQQVECGVCYTNSIRINGMEGPYTAVLIDGMPVMSALGAVYGLNGLHPALIQQIEIIKGPASTLYGTEAMAGVINIITRRPELAPRLSLHSFVTSDYETNIDLAAAPTIGPLKTLISGTLFYMGNFIDDNGDGFSDVPLTRRASLFAKGILNNRDRIKVLDLSARYYAEDRFGGVQAWTPEHRGSGEIYGESVYTHRFELIGSYRLPPMLAARAGAAGMRFDFAANHHDQDSYYGSSKYAARQSVLYGHLIWNRSLGAAHDLLLGGTLRFQAYDDNTPATLSSQRRLIPGVLAQHEATLGRRLRTLTGLRMDHHAEHGAILSPRLSVKFKAGENTTFRVNSGTGFRVVNLFTEDHAALTGARDVVIAEKLRPERSASLTANLYHIIPFGTNPLVIDADGFYTRFSNRIIPDYDTDPNLILYRNLAGTSVSRGVALSISQSSAALPLSYSLGLTLLDAYTDEAGQREPILYASEYQGTAGASYHFPRAEVTIDYTASLTGPMRLPSYEQPFERPTRSTPFTLHHVRVAWTASHVQTPTRHMDVDLYAAVENILDHVQPSPLIDPTNPFGDHFDTAYVYGPLQGRNVAVGVRLTVW